MQLVSWCHNSRPDLLTILNLPYHFDVNTHTVHPVDNNHCFQTFGTFSNSQCPGLPICVAPDGAVISQAMHPGYIMCIWLTWPTIFVLPTQRTKKWWRFLEILKRFRHGILLESWDCPSHTSKNDFLPCCLYGRSYRNSSLCGAGICISTLVPFDWTNLNPLDAAMCIQGTENGVSMPMMKWCCYEVYIYSYILSAHQ